MNKNDIVKPILQLCFCAAFTVESSVVHAEYYIVTKDAPPTVICGNCLKHRHHAVTKPYYKGEVKAHVATHHHYANYKNYHHSWYYWETNNFDLDRRTADDVGADLNIDY